MAVDWVQQWVPASAGVLSSSTLNSRNLAFLREELIFPLIEFRWTDTGAVGGTILNVSEPPCVIPMIEDISEAGAWGQVGIYGPIYDTVSPGIDTATLLFLRTFFPSAAWVTQLATGGNPADAQQSAGSRSGRSVIIFEVS
jgi:hypothetical protein